MIVGGTMTGGGALLGRVAGLEGRATVAGIDLRWVHEGAPVDFDGTLAVGVDGELSARLAAGESALALGWLETGGHRIDVLPLGSDVVTPPDLHGAPYGSRAWVTWTPSADADLAGYRVYWDAGTGTVDLEEPIAEVDDVVVQARPWSRATSGTGTGRVSVRGDWTGSIVNKTCQIEIRAGGKFRHNVSGAWSAERSIVKGRGYVLHNGVLVTFHDDAADYDEGDEHDFRIGPKAGWNSGELEGGTYLFAVAPVDSAGNEGTATAAARVRIVRLPEEVSELAASWDGSDVDLSWTLPTGTFAAVHVYSNYSNDFGRLEGGVIEAAPWATLAGDATSHSFTPGVNGTWRFVVRVEDSEGRISDSIAAVSVDTTAAAEGAGIGVPFDVTVTPAAGGTFVVAWAYAWQASDELDHFDVYVHESETGTFAAAADTVVPTRGTEPIWRGSWTSPSYPAARWFTVRAVNGEEVDSGNTDTTGGTPDAAAPTISGDAVVLAN